MRELIEDILGALAVLACIVCWPFLLAGLL